MDRSWPKPRLCSKRKYDAVSSCRLLLKVEEYLLEISDVPLLVNDDTFFLVQLAPRGFVLTIKPDFATSVHDAMPRDGALVRRFAKDT
jgi:hypothetical protein